MNFIKNIFSFFFGEPTVESAVKEINKAIAKLEKAVSFQHGKAADAAIAAELAKKASELAIAERDRAERIAKKMGDLLS